MKIKIIVVASLLLAFGSLVRTSTPAQVMTGLIQVTGAKAPGLTGLKCGDIVVEAVSRERTGKPALTPKWQRQAKATGSWAKGYCSYKMKVETNSFFSMSLGAETSCNGQTIVKSTPPRANGLKVDTSAVWRTDGQNFKIDSIRCVPIK